MKCCRYDILGGSDHPYVDCFIYGVFVWIKLSFKSAKGKELAGARVPRWRSS